MSLEAYDLAREGYLEKNKDSWEQTRSISYYSILPYLKKDTSIEKFMPFVWDIPKRKNKKMTPEERNQLIKKASNKFNL